MNTNTVFEDLDLIEYKEAWEFQESKFNAIINTKLYNRSHPDEFKALTHHLIFCEHPNVYTLGKSGQVNNLLINDAFLKQINATYYKSNRGGDITYHGPGQIVGYPIFDLEEMGLTVKSYIHLLEESIINCIADYGLQGSRLDGATGVWLDKDVPGKARKICAIGVKASRYVSMHGFALNVNTDLSYFNHINPCGFVDKGVTSLKKELGRELDFKEVKNKLLDHIIKVFKLNISSKVG
ncbi:lipoyl(octanoyl) transferase LipB [Labilibacter sediminis]|nr:lipoyl(octanoyl) transferase LipB [Labilibacter sediminis]